MTPQAKAAGRWNDHKAVVWAKKYLEAALHIFYVSEGKRAEIEPRCIKNRSWRGRLRKKVGS